MLSLAARDDVQTLLDATTLHLQDSEKIALIYVQTDQPVIKVTRSEFRLRAVLYANAMIRMGIRKRDMVIIAHTQNLESVYLFWGAIFMGAIPSMFPTLTEKLDPIIYMGNLTEVVRLSEVRAIFTTDEFAPTLREKVTCSVVGNSDLQADVNITIELHRPQAEDIAFLQHSSGTTGLQKGVALSHQAVLNQIASYSDAIKLTKQDVVVSWLPLYHDMGLIAGFILPILQGIPLVLMSPFDWVAHPALLLRAIHDHFATLTWMPNFAYNHMARRIRQRDSEGLSLASIRAFINCSEPVRADSHTLFLERFAANGATAEQLQVSYAMAENTFAVTQTPIRSAARLDIVDRIVLQERLLALNVPDDHPNAAAQISCGVPIANTGVKIVGDTRNILEERQVGEVYVHSNCMLTEYYHRPDLSPFDADGWYKTGDRGYIAKGQLYIIGRSKDLIINAGKNIYPQDLEAIVNGIEGVHAGRAVAFGVPDEKEGTELIAIVAEVDTDDADTRKKISQQIRQMIAQQTDVTVNFVGLVESGWLIKTSSGKISRSKNRKKWLASRE